MCTVSNDINSESISFSNLFCFLSPSFPRSCNTHDYIWCNFLMLERRISRKTNHCRSFVEVANDTSRNVESRVRNDLFVTSTKNVVAAPCAQTTRAKSFRFKNSFIKFCTQWSSSLCFIISLSFWPARSLMVTLCGNRATYYYLFLRAQIKQESCYLGIISVTLCWILAEHVTSLNSSNFRFVYKFHLTFRRKILTLRIFNHRTYLCQKCARLMMCRFGSLFFQKIIICWCN